MWLFENIETLCLIENTTESLSYSETKELNCCWKLYALVEVDASKAFQRSSIGPNIYSFTTESCCFSWFRIWMVVLNGFPPWNTSTWQHYVTPNMCMSFRINSAFMYTVFKTNPHLYCAHIRFSHWNYHKRHHDQICAKMSDSIRCMAITGSQ